MEIIFECIINFFADFLLQLICELAIEFGLRRFADTTEPEMCMPAVSFLGYGLLGLFVGGASLLIFPHPFVRSSRFYGISLLITPILTGLAMSGMGWLRKRQGKVVLRIDTFSYGFIFAFGLALIRLVYTK